MEYYNLGAGSIKSITVCDMTPFMPRYVEYLPSWNRWFFGMDNQTRRDQVITLGSGSPLDLKPSNYLQLNFVWTLVLDDEHLIRWHCECHNIYGSRHQWKRQLHCQKKNGQTLGASTPTCSEVLWPRRCVSSLKKVNNCMSLVGAFNPLKKILYNPFASFPQNHHLDNC